MAALAESRHFAEHPVKNLHQDQTAAETSLGQLRAGDIDCCPAGGQQSISPRGHLWLGYIEAAGTELGC